MKRTVFWGMLSMAIVLLISAGIPPQSEAGALGKKLGEKQRSIYVFTPHKQRGYGQNQLGVLKPVQPGFSKAETNNDLKRMAVNNRNAQEDASPLEEHNEVKSDMFMDFFRKIANYFAY